MKSSKSNKKKEKYWHCLDCGKNQDGSNRICENCGKDLMCYGERRFINDVSDDNIDDGGDRDNTVVKKILKKLFISAGVICGLIALGSIILMLISDKPYINDDTTVPKITTTAPTTTSPFTTTQPNLKNDILGKWANKDNDYFYEFLSGTIVQITSDRTPAVGRITAKGVYSLDDDKLNITITSLSQINQNYTISIKNDTLTMTNKDNETQTYKRISSIPEPTTTSAPVSDDNVFPDFQQFANGYATVSEKEVLDYFTKIVYKISVNDAYEIMEEYAQLLLSEYDFKELYKGEKKYFHGFEYTGAESLSSFYLSFSNGEEKYENLNFSVNNYRENGVEYIVVRYSEGLEPESTNRRTTYTENTVNPLSLPDFQIFGNGYCPKIKTVTNSNDNLVSVYYEIRKDEILDDYIELLKEYSFELLYDNKVYNWKGFKYTGSGDLESFSLVLEDTDGTQIKYDYNNLSAYVYDDSETGKRTIKLMYPDNLDVVEPIRKTTVG